MTFGLRGTAGFGRSTMPAAMARIATAAAVARITERLAQRRWSTCRSAVPRASRNSAAECSRAPGSLASARATAFATEGGVSGRTSVSGLGVAVRWAAITACAVGPANGGKPASIS